MKVANFEQLQAGVHSDLNLPAFKTCLCSYFPLNKNTGPALGMGGYLQIICGLSLCLAACSLALGVYRRTQQLIIPWMVSMLLFTVVLIMGNVHLWLLKVCPLMDNPNPEILQFRYNTIKLFCLISNTGRPARAVWRRFIGHCCFRRPLRTERKCYFGYNFHVL